MIVINNDKSNNNSNKYDFKIKQRFFIKLHYSFQ